MSKKINMQDLIRAQRDVVYSVLGVVLIEGECYGDIKERVEKSCSVVLKRKKSVHCYMAFFAQYLYFFKGGKQPGYDSALPLLVVDLLDTEKGIKISELRTSNGLIPKLKHLEDTFVLRTFSDEIYVKVDMGKDVHAAKDWVKLLKMRHTGLTSVIMNTEFEDFLEFLVGSDYIRINVSEYPGAKLEGEWFDKVCCLYQALKKWKELFVKFRNRVWISDQIYQYLDWFSNEDTNIEKEFMDLTNMFVKWAEEINALDILDIDATIEAKINLIEKWKHVTHDEYGIKYYVIPAIRKDIYLVLGREEYMENISSQVLDFTEIEIIRDDSTFIKSFTDSMDMDSSEDMPRRGSISETLSSRSTFSFDDRSSFSASEMAYEDFIMLKPLVIDELVWKEVNNELILIGGTREKLVERLIIERSPEVQDDLIQSFMMTYRSIFSPLELLDQFMFTFKYLYKLSVQELSSSETRYILIKMSNILCTWVTDHYLDFYDDETFYDIFVEKITLTIGPLDDILRKKIVTALDTSKLTFENRELSTHAIDSPPPVIMPKRNTLDGFHPLELARQICLFEQKIFTSIQSVELMDQNWSKHPEKSPNVLKAIQFFNNLSSAFSTKICSIDNPKDRGKMLEKLFLTTTYLREFNNYGSAMALISCTNSSSIHRMKITWQHACQRKEKVFETFQEVQESLSPEGSYKKFRDAVHCTPSPLIPYIGVYLTDLTFIDDGNTKYINVEQDREDIVNFEKMRMVSKIMVEIRRQQETPYNFEPIPGMQNFLEGVLFGMNCEEDMVVYEKSRALEPKDKIEQYMASNRPSGLKHSVRSLNRKSSLILSGVLKQLS